jgi:uncharacterized protein (TIGR02118 family)
VAKLIILYPEPEDRDFFEKHYWNVHVPLAMKIPMLKQFEATTRVPDVVAGALKVFKVVVLTFDSMADLEAAMKSPESRAATADLENFAPPGRMVFVCDMRDIPVADSVNG